MATGGVLNEAEIQAEINLYPRGDFPQNLFRADYNIELRHAMGRNGNGSAKIALDEAVAEVRKRYPTFVPARQR